MDLAAFVTANLDRRQAIAEAALAAAVGGDVPARTPGAWHAPGEDPGQPSGFELVFEPEAVLLDIAAQRRIVEEYAARNTDVDLMLGPTTQRQREWAGLQLAVRILAQADDWVEGYDERWRVA